MLRGNEDGCAVAPSVDASIVRARPALIYREGTKTAPGILRAAISVKHSTERSPVATEGGGLRCSTFIPSLLRSPVSVPGSAALSDPDDQCDRRRR